MVQQYVNLGFEMQPEPPVLPSSLSIASSTARLLRLPMRVHRACGGEGQCSESCSCLASKSWKPVPASAWNEMCIESCGDAASAAVALVDSEASHSFVSAELVSRFSLPVKAGGDMEVTLADGSQVEALQTCCVPLVVLWRQGTTWSEVPRALCQTATEENSGLVRNVMVHQSIKMSSEMQPKPPVLPS